MSIETAQGEMHHRELEVRGDRDVRFDLEPPAELSGRVVDAETGQPVVAYLVLKREIVPGRRATGGQATSEVDGSFRLAVAAGIWRLEISTSGYARQSVPIDLDSGEVRSGFEIALNPAHRFTLLVTSETGSPARLITVFQTGRDGRVLARQRRAVSEEGSVEFDFLPEGTWNLWVHSPLTPATPFQVTIPGEPVAVTLPAGGSVDLRVPELEGREVRSRLRIRRPDGKVYTSPILEGRGWSVYGGRSRIAPLPVGVWALEIESSDGQTWRAMVEVLPDQVVKAIAD